MSSTEKAHDGPRRRSPLVVASVVAAVLVAGGGGAYFAAGSGGGDGTAGGRSGTGEDAGPAPLLALDTAGGGIAPANRTRTAAVWSTGRPANCPTGRAGRPSGPPRAP
ncbi:hypothetical protein ACFQ60_16435 [Streptomyces zhihengii]